MKTNTKEALAQILLEIRKTTPKTQTAYGFVQVATNELPHKHRNILRKICHQAVFIKEVDSDGAHSFRARVFFNGIKIYTAVAPTLAEAKQQLIAQAQIAINGETE